MLSGLLVCRTQELAADELVARNDNLNQSKGVKRTSRSSFPWSIQQGKQTEDKITFCS